MRYLLLFLLTTLIYSCSNNTVNSSSLKLQILEGMDCNLQVSILQDESIYIIKDGLILYRCTPNRDKYRKVKSAFFILGLIIISLILGGYFYYLNQANKLWNQ